MYPFKKYFILISLVLGSFYISAQSSDLITFDINTEGRDFLYNPYFGQSYNIKIFNGGIAEIWDSGDYFTFSEYDPYCFAFGSENLNYSFLRDDDSGYAETYFNEQMGTSLFHQSVFGALIGTTKSNEDLFYSVLYGSDYGEYENSEWMQVMSTMMSPVYYRYLGYFFFPRSAQIYLSSKGEIEHDISTLASMSDVQKQTFIDTFENFAETQFEDWYNSTSFVDTYGLVTNNLSDEANAVIDLAMAAFTSPAPFTIDQLIDASSDVIYLSNFDESYWGSYYHTDGTYHIAPKTEHFGELVDKGVIDNIYEAELFNVWFITEYFLTDAFPLLLYSESGQSALSLHQIAVDSILPGTVAKSSILKPKTSSQSSTADKEEVVIQSNSPYGDTSLLFFNTYNRLGQMIKVSSTLDYMTPKGRFEIGANLNYLKSFYNYNNKTFDTLDFSIKGQMNIFKDSNFPIHIFDSIGVTLNDTALMANYINANVGIYQEFKSRFLNIAIGEIILGKYWSQFPQMDVKALSAMRVSLNLFGLGALSADVIYTKALGVLYDSEWTNYSGANTDYLNIGAGLDLNFSDSFSLNLTTRKDFLMPGFSSLEFALGAAFVF